MRYILSDELGGFRWTAKFPVKGGSELRSVLLEHDAHWRAFLSTSQLGYLPFRGKPTNEQIIQAYFTQATGVQL